MDQKPRPKKYSFLLLPFAFLLLTYLSCEKSKTPTNMIVNKPEIYLSLAEEPRLREIRLKLKLSNIKLPQNFQLSR